MNRVGFFKGVAQNSLSTTTIGKRPGSAAHVMRVTNSAAAREHGWHVNQPSAKNQNLISSSTSSSIGSSTAKNQNQSPNLTCPVQPPNGPGGKRPRNQNSPFEKMWKGVNEHFVAFTSKDALDGRKSASNSASGTSSSLYERKAHNWQFEKTIEVPFFDQMFKIFGRL